jgi:predicted  nucleic acid-binding Zn-ribbon protein
VAGKKVAKKKTGKQDGARNLALLQAQLDKRVDKLTAQLDEMRGFVKKELAQDLRNTRKYADAEMAIQKRRFDQLLDKIKKENQELRSRMSKYIEEHEVLKGVTTGIAETAKSLEERVRKILSRDS